jgi:hypothetical protein
MKHNSGIASIEGTIVTLNDGSRWEVTDFKAGMKLPLWMVMDGIEGDDFGLKSHLTNTNRGETLSANLIQ